MKFCIRLMAITAIASLDCSLIATELYNLQFSGADIGIYQTVGGHPSVQSTVGPLRDALVFHASDTSDQIKLPIDIVGPRYEIQFDVLVHDLLNSRYNFGPAQLTPGSSGVIFNGQRSTIDIFQSGSAVISLPFSNDRVYHFDISIDNPARHWSIALDGVQAYAGLYNSQYLERIDFGTGLSPKRGGERPGVYAALDNVVVTVVPEPSACGMVLLAGGMAWVLVCLRRS